MNTALINKFPRLILRLSHDKYLKLQFKKKKKTFDQWEGQTHRHGPNDNSIKEYFTPILVIVNTIILGAVASEPLFSSGREYEFEYQEHTTSSYIKTFSYGDWDFFYKYNFLSIE